MHLKMLSILILTLFPSTILAHWEDPQGCAKAKEHIESLGSEWEKVYDGVSEDGRDYVVRYKHDSLIAEEHFSLVPPSQWEKPDVPERLPYALSEWLDWDGDGTYNEWYLFPRGASNCEDALHFIWDSNLQTYKLYAAGKERT